MYLGLHLFLQCTSLSRKWEVKVQESSLKNYDNIWHTRIPILLLNWDTISGFETARTCTKLSDHRCSDHQSFWHYETLGLQGIEINLNLPFNFYHFVTSRSLKSYRRRTHTCHWDWPDRKNTVFSLQ